MRARGQKACTFEGKIYPHGAEACIEGKCMICNAGEWLERVEMCRVSRQKREEQQAKKMQGAGI